MMAFSIMIMATVIFVSIAGAYFVGLNAGDVAARKAIHAQQKAIHAQQVAEQGRSKALCNALLQLATTTQAHKLHPIFVRVYDNTGCENFIKKHP